MRTRRSAVHFAEAAPAAGVDATVEETAGRQHVFQS